MPKPVAPATRSRGSLWVVLGFVGIALGSRRGFTFTLEGGVGYLSFNAKGGTSTINRVTVTTSDWSSSSFTPVARLSFVYFF